MPSQFDTSYNYEYSKPTFDEEADKLKAQVIREADNVLELRPPREPTRAEELAYQDWYESLFLSL